MAHPVYWGGYRAYLLPSEVQWLQSLQASLPVRDGGLRLRSSLSFLPLWLRQQVPKNKKQGQDPGKPSSFIWLLRARLLLSLAFFLYVRCRIHFLRGRLSRAVQIWRISSELPTAESSLSDVSALRFWSPPFSQSQRRLTFSLRPSNLWWWDRQSGCPVIIRLRHNLCVPHQCRCGAQVDAVGLHSFVCNKQAASQHPLNYVQELFHQPAYTSRQWANRSLPHRQWTPW